MNLTFLPFALIVVPFVGAFLAYLIGKKNKSARNVIVCAVGVIELALAGAGLVNALSGYEIVSRAFYVCGFGMTFRMDGFRSLYTCVAAFMWCLTLLLSPQYFSHYHNRNRYYFFNLLTLGATVGVFLSDDLYTTFVFFEIMSFASYPWVAHDQTPEAMRAAQTYLAVAVLGGMVTLMGLFMLSSMAGTVSFAGLRAYADALENKASLYLPGALVFFGFAAKAGVFPLHIWLPKAHPVAPAPASALLSGILTKTGVFGILVVSANLFFQDAVWGEWMLLLGVVTMFVGALLALFSVDLKRTLACSSMSQIGFIMVGVGMMGLLGENNALAAQGTLLHMVNHSLIKLTLFMAAGVVFMNLHKLNLNDIRGFGRKKPLLHFAFLMGYLGLIGMPLFNGYISKSLIHESLLEYVGELNALSLPAFWYSFAEKAFVFTGGMTAAYMTKLYVSIFWEKNTDAAVQAKFDGTKKYMNGLSAFSLTLSAIVLPVLGFFPQVLMTRLGALGASFMRASVPGEVAYFSLENLLGAGKSLLIGAVLYAGIRWLLMEKRDGARIYVNRWPQWLDLEESVYRPLVSKALPAIGYFFAHIADALPDCRLVRVYIPSVVTAVTRAFDQLIDGAALLLRHTLLDHLHRRKAPPVGTRLTWYMGTALNGCVFVLNKTFRRRRPITTDFVATLAAWREEMGDTGRRVTRSVSFGLLLLCVGLYITFAYLMTL